MLEYIINNPLDTFYWVGVFIAFLWACLSDTTIEKYDPFTNVIAWILTGLLSWLAIFYSLVLMYHKHKKDKNG